MHPERHARGPSAQAIATPAVMPVPVSTSVLATRRAQLERALKVATRASERACSARAALPPGSSRARVTTANARWMRAAEERDRVQAQLQAIDDVCDGTTPPRGKGETP